LIVSACLNVGLIGAERNYSLVVDIMITLEVTPSGTLPKKDIRKILDRYTYLPETRKRQASGQTSVPPQKRLDNNSTPPMDVDGEKKKKHRGPKKPKNIRRGPRSDKALRDRGCKMVYIGREEGGDLPFDKWKEVVNGIHDRIFAMDPDDATFPIKGYPRIARMAFHGGDHFVACIDDETSAWVREAAADIMRGIGAGTPTFAEHGRHEGYTAYCVVLPDRAEKLGPERATEILLRQNRWKGTAHPLRGFVRPSGEEDRRAIVLLYFSADKVAEESFVLDGLRGHFGGAEIRLRRKRRTADGSVPIDVANDAKATSEEVPAASSEANQASAPPTS